MKGLIFDLDGTLLNTLGDIGKACNHTLAKNGYPVHEIPAYRKMVGSGFEKLIERALGFRPENLAALVGETRSYYREHMTEDTAPYPEMTEALITLRDKGVKLAVLSNKPDELSKILIAKYFPEIKFEAVVGAIEDIPLKPDPSSLEKLLAQMNLPRDEAAYCGDSDVDMLTAKNAGVAGIGAGWGFRGADELVRAGAARVCTSPRELLLLAY
ncbi:MAG: HAD family hydrolase [Desulfovibrio sp.]|nr:HAD family hydrolase [Desulfovibrio sp.]